jgi:hypothetical protein
MDGSRVSLDAQASDGKGLYGQIKAFALTGQAVEVQKLLLKRDRVEMTLTGTLYLSGAIDGRVGGAVFIGDGNFRAEVPPARFERDHVRRLLNADVVDSDFRTAVLRWTDDTAALFDGARSDVTVPEQAKRLAAEFEPRVTRETGVNLSARLAASVLNGEQPGVFFGQFDGGRRGRFSYVLDHQNRIPVANFNINAGEKGLIFAYQQPIFWHDVWLAFWSLEDYGRRAATYSDANDAVDITAYRLDVDVHDFDREMGLKARIDMTARRPDVRAVPFAIGESLSASQSMRLERQLRLTGARMGGQELAFVQEDWESGFTVFLPAALAAGQTASIEVDLAGDFIDGDPAVPECFYPLSNVTWLPRHGYLDRATFDITYRHRKRDRIASIGARTSEAADPADPDVMITKYVINEPVALAVFAIGPFQRHGQTVKWEAGGRSTPLEFNSVPARVRAIKADFILAELDNALRYFAAMFGQYPYATFGAAFHPFGFGQGFPTLLMIPPTDAATPRTFAFIAHETAHQWWGNIVAWRSYRDQWLSEGFAEYSGYLYMLRREPNPEWPANMIRGMREALRNPPRTAVGVGSGRLNDVGPIVLGLRLQSSKSLGAYQALVYAKGALVLRMLHFLMTDPATANDKAFTDMMTAFVERHRNGTAATADFERVAAEHFARTPIARKYGLTDLRWFFVPWTERTELPSYTLEYQLADQDGGVMLTGTLTQENAVEGQFMPLPLLLTFDKNQEARTVVAANGPTTQVQLKLPMRPRKIELDPHSWILSEKTTTRSR